MELGGLSAADERRAAGVGVGLQLTFVHVPKKLLTAKDAKVALRSQRESDVAFMIAVLQFTS